MAGASLDKALDALYAAPPGEFVKRRDALAGNLREEGEREAADRVKALRRPTVAAWAVNQLARREKMRLRGLFTAGERLRAAHAETLAGGLTPALAEAREDEKEAIEELARAAGALLEEQGRPPSEVVLDRIRDTLHAAVVDPAVDERVRTGRLEREERVTGFGFAPASGAATAKPARGKASDEKRRAERARTRKLRELETRLRAARSEADAARAAVDRAKRELERAERTLADSLAAVETAERELEEGRTT